MASVTASFSASSVVCTTTLFNQRVAVSSSPVLGLPTLKRKSNVVVCCSTEVKPTEKESMSTIGMGASVLAAAAAAATMSSPAQALVDDRMSTEGTGLPFGLSNGILGWILLAGFAFIWSLYFVYASGLDEDEDSGLSL